MRSHSVPTFGPAKPALITLVPFMSQIAAWPPSCCNWMSLLPSLLKSPVP